MSCHCETLPETLYLQQAPRSWTTHLQHTDTSPLATLHRCPTCHQHWAIDKPRRQEPQIATRITDPAHWQPATPAQRKHLLAHTRGGTTDTPCIWAGCGAPTVHQTIYCIDHLYETGARI